MRHGKKFNHLGRTTAHRKAMLANMATSLITHKRISTTLAKAKALRTYVEPILTKSKEDTTHSRRTVFSYLQDKDAVTMLFRDIATKIANRPGGYTRIIKLNNRLGDNAEMALIELVDYNEVYGQDAAAAEKKTTRRSRSKVKKSDVISDKTAAESSAKAPASEEEAVVIEETSAEASVSEETVVATEEASAKASVSEETVVATEESSAKASVSEETVVATEEASAKAPASEEGDTTEEKEA